jgi:hypothetical protein
MKIKEWIDTNDSGAVLIPFSGALESKLIDISPEEREAYLKENNATRFVRLCLVVKLSFMQGFQHYSLYFFQ